MESLPLIIFRYSGKYAHFRRPYTNVSSLSYPFPPRPAIAGLLGAILGVRKDKVAEVFGDKKLKVAVSIEQQIKTVTHVTNFRQDGVGGIGYTIRRPPKGWKPKELKNVPPYNEATQIPMELLRSPFFIIYTYLADNELHGQLLCRLKTERYVYTPCLGLSEFLANIEYIGSRKAYQLPPGEYEIRSVIAKDECLLVREKLEMGGHQIQELKAPYIGNTEREFTYRRYIVNMVPGTLPVRCKVNVYKVENTIISFL